MKIVGVDGGNYEVKAISESGADKFPSDLGEYRERNLKQKFTDNDMVVEYRGQKFFAGSLAKYESEFNGTMMGATKAHDDAKIRVLIALHRQNHDCFSIIVGQPIGQHNEQEKQAIKTMLRGWQDIHINGKKQKFYIERVEIAAEGGAAFWASPRDGLVRVIDIGSGTVNLATLDDKRYVDRDSLTMMLGANTTKSQNLEAMARTIAAEALKKWSKDDVVFLAGGPAQSFYPYLLSYFPGTEVLKPHIIAAGQRMQLPPTFANACGFYRIGVNVFG